MSEISDWRSRGGDLDYHNLKCPKCGNTERFIEFAKRTTRQLFSVSAEPDTEPDWDLFETVDNEEAEPDQIWCANCDKRCDEIVVWDSEEGYR